jgi:hypothetical protein
VISEARLLRSDVFIDRLRPMHTQIRRLTIFSAVALAALLMVGAAAASAHGWPGVGGASTGALVTQAAKELDVTRAKLKSAIVGSAFAAINAAAEDGDIDADEAAELKEEAEDNLRVAYHLSKTRTVPSEPQRDDGKAQRLVPRCPEETGPRQDQPGGRKRRPDR